MITTCLGSRVTADATAGLAADAIPATPAAFINCLRFMAPRNPLHPSTGEFLHPPQPGVTSMGGIVSDFIIDRRDSEILRVANTRGNGRVDARRWYTRHDEKHEDTAPLCLGRQRSADARVSR